MLDREEYEESVIETFTERLKQELDDVFDILASEFTQEEKNVIAYGDYHNTFYDTFRNYFTDKGE